MSETNIKQLVEAFLCWPLPKDFSPDGGIEFTPPRQKHMSWPTGTNLLTASQAEEMLQRIIADDYLKENETVADCIARNRADTSRVMGLLADEKFKSEQLQATNKQLLEALEKAYKRLDTRGADVHNVSSVKSIIQQAITNAKQQANQG